MVAGSAPRRGQARGATRRLIGMPHARGFARHRPPSVRARGLGLPTCLPGMSRGRGWPTKLTTSTPIRISVSVTELRLDYVID